MKKLFIFLIVFFCLCVSAYSEGTDTVTLTTYYPAPVGVYQKLILDPQDDLGDCDSTQEGALKYADATDEIMYCDGVSDWQSVGTGAAAGGNWTLNETPVPDALHPNEDVWNVGIGTTTPTAKLQVEGGAVMAYCSTSPGSCAGVTPVSGEGTRFMWIPKKGAFRAGYVSGSQWDDSNIGYYSTATGYNTTAFQSGSVAMGYETSATGEYSVAMGYQTTASGLASVTMGYQTTASAYYSVAMGENTIASGTGSVVFGSGSKALGLRSFAAGYQSEAQGDNSVALGYRARAMNNSSMALGLSGAYCDTSATGQLKICGDVEVTGNFNVGGTKFKIPHPDSSKPEGTFLMHSAVESPTAGDNLYRWQIDVRKGKAVIQLPRYYKYLNTADTAYIAPAGHFGRAYGKVDEKQEILTVYADSDGEYNVLLIGTRKDKYATESWEGPEVYIEPKS